MFAKQEKQTMATASSAALPWKNDYPTSDGKPLAETDWHRDLMIALIQTLKLWYATRRRVYVSGNLLLFYEEGNRRRHVAPDVFVVKASPDTSGPTICFGKRARDRTWLSS